MSLYLNKQLVTQLFKIISNHFLKLMLELNAFQNLSIIYIIRYCKQNSNQMDKNNNASNRATWKYILLTVFVGTNIKFVLGKALTKD